MADIHKLRLVSKPSAASEPGPCRPERPSAQCKRLAACRHQDQAAPCAQYTQSCTLRTGLSPSGLDAVWELEELDRDYFPIQRLCRKAQVELLNPKHDMSWLLLPSMLPSEAMASDGMNGS